VGAEPGGYLNYSTKCYRVESGDAVRIFTSRWFQRFARKEGISDSDLLDAVERAARGQIDADLGGEVIKQRIARRGQGRSKGYRTIVVLRRGERAFFVYGFAKSERADIDPAEVKQFKEAAKYLLALSEKQLAGLRKRGDFVEVRADGQKVS
jgi:hypothetical protein